MAMPRTLSCKLALSIRCGLFTLLVLLGYNVQKTFQCSSSPRPRDPPHISNMQDRNNSAQESETGNSSDSYFSRSSLGQETFQACSYRLRSELDILCSGKFYDPSTSKHVLSGRVQSGQRASPKKRTIILLRRIPRSVVNECCTQQCSRKTLLKYCRSESGRVDNETSQAAVSERVEETKTTSFQIDGDDSLLESFDADEDSEVHQSGNGTALNAITSTLPPKLIPLGPQTNDYIIQPIN